MEVTLDPNNQEKIMKFSQLRIEQLNHLYEWVTVQITNIEFAGTSRTFSDQVLHIGLTATKSEIKQEMSKRPVYPGTDQI